MTTLTPDPTGSSLISGAPVTGTGDPFQAGTPGSATPTGPTYAAIGPEQLETAVAAAVAARLAPIDLARVAEGLDTAANAMEADVEGLVAVADAETALGITRLTGELARTVGQLRMMAAEARDGRRRDVVTDPAGDGPAAPALHRTTVPLGVVVVFAASNFPLAFGVVGTDTAAALAAGCPVIAKAHPAQPATAERCGRVVVEALRAAGLPEGMLQVLHEGGHEVGLLLAGHPEVDAVAFTGSLRGGRALLDVAAARPRPIPVYAEMGSLNPVVVSPGAAAADPSGLARAALGSALLGEGQFCTKPGLLLLPDDDASRAVAAALVAGVRAHVPAHPLLHAGIVEGFEQGLASLAGLEGVEIERGAAGAGVPAAVVLATPQALQAHERLVEELFGPVTVVVRVRSSALAGVVAELPPSLTATVHATPAEAAWTRQMADLLARRVGRVVLGGWPTGVRVSAGQHHGGPYPATTSPLHTSVGLAAIDRFRRPVTFQSFDAETLPTWA